MSATAETTVRLLDLLEAHQGWDLIDGGELWSVAEWVAEWSAGAEAGDRGPVVTVWEERDGLGTVVALNEEGCPVDHSPRRSCRVDSRAARPEAAPEGPSRGGARGRPTKRNGTRRAALNDGRQSRGTPYRRA